MAEITEISWAHSTFNPWIGCTRVGPGCVRCYAATLMQDRYARVKWGAGQARDRTRPANWAKPRRWNRLARESGQPWRVFCSSLADVFDNEVPQAWREDLWQLIAATPNLTWMLLTKRIGNVAAMVPPTWLERGGWPVNVWLGITVVNQVEADRDIPKLQALPVPVRWLSCEPLLGALDLRRHLHHAPCPEHPSEGLKMASFGCMGCSDRISWVIVGGESGAGAREMDPDWARLVRDQCLAAGTAFHFKQWGGLRPAKRGHLLDGVEYRQFPAVSGLSHKHGRVANCARTLGRRQL